jgi:hypothetical protein
MYRVQNNLEKAGLPLIVSSGFPRSSCHLAIPPRAAMPCGPGSKILLPLYSAGDPIQKCFKPNVTIVAISTF